MSRERLSSRLGFILLAAGCAIGLGNIWRFPWMVGQYGGAIFLRQQHETTLQSSTYEPPSFVFGGFFAAETIDNWFCG